RRGSHRPITSTRLTRIQLFGRLVNSFSFRGCSGAGRPSSGVAPVSTGLCDKQGKKRSVPKANYAFPRHDSRLHLHGGQAVLRTNKCHQDMRVPVPTGTVSLVAVLPTPVRNDGVSRYRAPTRDVAYAAVPDVVPVSEAQRSHRQAPQSNGVLQMQENPGNLENPLVPRCVGHYGHSVTSRSSDHRRLHQGVGGSLRGERRERSLVCDRGHVSYKCVRTADSSPGSTTLSAKTEWSACVSEDGQHCGLGVYKPPRRSALPVTTPLGDSPAPVCSETRPVTQGSSYTRLPQLRCRPVIEGRSSSSRLVPSPTSDRSDLGAFFQGAGGPVREQAEHLLPALVLASGRRSPTRHRRAGPPVASPTPICFSPSSAPPACAGQGSGRGQGIDIDSPPLAQSAVGGRSGQYVSAAALGAASAEGPPNAGAQDSVTSPSRVVASQSLAPERCRLIASGLSDAVVATIQSARAVSTQALYTLKWRSFEQWCAARQHDPINCALGVILEFLQQLFDEGKAAS